MDIISKKENGDTSALVKITMTIMISGNGKTMISQNTEYHDIFKPRCWLVV